MNFREEIKKNVFSKGKLVHRSLNKSWYEQKKILFVLEKIYFETAFLDVEASLRERLLYISLDFFSPVFCNFCKNKQLRVKKNISFFYKSCSDQSCKKKLKSLASKINWKNHSNEKVEKIKNKISNSNKGKKRCLEVCQRQSNRMLGTKQSSITTARRVQSRKNNGNPWFSKETKQKLSNSNKITHSSKEFREKHKETYKNSRIKQSNTIKKKIASGEFTPPITNSWTRWEAFAVKNNKKKHFRSSWEAAFWLITDFEYEKIRIPYVLNGKNKIYITDFVDEKQKKIFEIKPDSTRETAKNKAKFSAAQCWATENGYSFEIIGESWFKSNLKEKDFYGNEHLSLPLRKLYEKGN